MDDYYAVIMAGGGGTRLWPLSRRARPKQMLKLFGERTLFQIAVERLEELFPPDRILVVTVHDQAANLQEQCPGIPGENFLLEPLPRGTASVVGLAAITLAERDPLAMMAVLTADHFIKDLPLFHRLLLAAREVAQAGFLVTLGITPTFPATGYGYIQQGASLGQYRDLAAYQVKRFIEKPDQLKAEAMLGEGEHSWNSGMFVWRVEQILAEIERQMPDLSRSLGEIQQSLGTPGLAAVLNRVWPQLRKETIDYGVMEGARQVAVIPAEGLGWSDVGSWDSLFELLSADQDGNIFMRGDHLHLSTGNTLLYNDQEGKLVVTIGVENLVVVDTGDVLLICQRDHAQQVRAAVQNLEQMQKQALL